MKTQSDPTTLPLADPAADLEVYDPVTGRHWRDEDHDWDLDYSWNDVWDY
jgi:hypothetical protein